MTTGKPPHPPQKTLLGMPSDVQEALKKLQAQKDQQALQQRTQVNPPSAPPQPSAAQGNLDRTLYGNPHDANAPELRSNAPRPNLPREQPFQPPVRGAAPQQPRPQVPSGHGIAGTKRTVVGMPSDVVAAMQHLQGRAPAAAPSPAPQPQTVQSSRAAEAPATSWPPAAEPASPWVKPQAGPQTSVAPQPTAAVAQATQVRQTAAARAAQPEQAAQPPQPTASRSGVVQRGVTAASVPPPLAPRATATAADRERTPAPNVTASAAPSRPETVSKSVNPPPNTPTGQANGMLATRLVTFEPGALVATPPSRTSLPEIQAPALNLADQGAPVRAAPVKRWPALSLLGLAFVAFGGVVVVRAPGLLPAPLAALLAPRRPPAPEAQPNATPPTPPPSAANEPAQPAAPTSEPAAPAVAAAAVPPTAAEPQAPAQPAATAAPAAAMQGSSAELEKQAIDLLLANDYAAARGVYERLKVAEPTRAEYGIMLDLLARELSPTCGGPGQVPCENP